MFLDSIERRTAIINLDFANDRLPYKATIDVRDMITLQKAMEDFTLGPNGGLVFCMESLLHNIEWLLDQIEQLDVDYVIFDCPGQVINYGLVITNHFNQLFYFRLSCTPIIMLSMIFSQRFRKLSISSYVVSISLIHFIAGVFLKMFTSPFYFICLVLKVSQPLLYPRYFSLQMLC